MKKVIVFFAMAILIYAGAVSYFYFDLFEKNKKLNLLFDESQNLKLKLQDEISRAAAKQDSLQKENELLKKESLDYLKQQGQLNKKQGVLEKNLKQQLYALKESSKRLEANKVELEKLKEENQDLADISSLAGNVKAKKQAEKIAKLESDLTSANARLKKQEALLHYNLGVSYTKEKNYEMAIDEYEKVLAVNSQDADTHYNLAILYDDFRKNPKRAVEHYQKFLELRPQAPEIDEVKEWISRLEKTLGIDK